MSEENDVVDIEELKEIMDNDMELIRECFSDFVQDWPELYVQIKGAVMAGDNQTLDEAAHKLKGTLRYLAAEPAARAAQALESAGKENARDRLDEKLQILEDECKKLITYIKRFSV